MAPFPSYTELIMKSYGVIEGCLAELVLLNKRNTMLINDILFLETRENPNAEQVRAVEAYRQLLIESSKEVKQWRAIMERKLTHVSRVR